MRDKVPVYVVGYIDLKEETFCKGKVFTDEEKASKYANHLEGLYVNELENNQGFVLAGIMDFVFDKKEEIE